MDLDQGLEYRAPDRRVADALEREGDVLRAHRPLVRAGREVREGGIGVEARALAQPQGVGDAPVRQRLRMRDLLEQPRHQGVGTLQVLVLEQGAVDVADHRVVVHGVGDLRVQRLRRVVEGRVEDGARVVGVGIGIVRAGRERERGRQRDRGNATLHPPSASDRTASPSRRNISAGSEGFSSTSPSWSTARAEPVSIETLCASAWPETSA